MMNLFENLQLIKEANSKYNSNRINLVDIRNDKLKESKEVYIKDEGDFHIIHDANTRKELFRAMKDGGANNSTIEDLIKQFDLSIVEKPNGVTKPLNSKEPIVTLTVDGSPFECEEDEDKFMLNIKNNYDLNVTFKDRGDYNSYFTFKGTFSEIKRYFSDTKWDDWYLDWEDDEEIKSKYLQSINSDNDADWEDFLYESIHLNEMLSESKFKQPSRIRFKSEKLKQNKELFNKINIQAELLLDNNGEYVVCLPGTKDWVDLIKELLDADIESIGSNI